MSRPRVRYLFVDMNSYFASVEQQARPELRGRPIGVIPMDTDTTCCIAASYEAKYYGVKTGTGAGEAKRLCPAIQLVIARPDLYVEYHHRIVEAVESCLHVDCVSSIDEMYGRLMGDECQPDRALDIANKVKNAIWTRVGRYVRCSVGLAPNVWLAKVATDMQKPDGLVAILPDDLPHKLFMFELTDLPGIARRMKARLYRHGIESVAQLCALSEQQLAKIWESKVLGAIWYQQLRGFDLPYRPTRRGRVGHSHVLPPAMRTEERARGVMVRMIHKAASRMRRLGYSAGRLDVQISHLDAPSWKAWQLIVPASRDTHSILQTFRNLWQHRSEAIRRMPPFKVSMVLSDLTADASRTDSLFAAHRDLSVLSDVMDRVDAKYGRHTVYFGSMFGHQKSAPTRISFTEIPDADEF